MRPLEVALAALEELREATERHLALPDDRYALVQLRYAADRAKAAQRHIQRAQSREMAQGAGR